MNVVTSPPAYELHIEEARPGQHHREATQPQPLTDRRQKSKAPESDMRLVSGRGLEAHRRLHNAGPTWGDASDNGSLFERVTTLG